MAVLEISALRKAFASHVAVDGVSLSVAAGELIAILGPSGCGKTTTLRMVAGFVEPTSGRIVLNGRDITRVPANRRDIGMVFQSYALFPHMTVRQNVEFGLVSHRISRPVLQNMTNEALELVGLRDLGDRYPRQLSGGQQQRVAVARVLALRPQLLLFDEPLSNLDAKLRIQTRQEIRRLQKSVGVAALFVTHDQEEASAIADRIVVLNEGRIEQIGSPTEIYYRPASRFVATFIGTSNFLAGQVVHSNEGRIRVRTLQGYEFSLPGSAAKGIAGVLCVRPETIDFGESLGEDLMTGQVRQILRNGPTIEYHIELSDDVTILVHQYMRHSATVRSEGETVALVLRGDDMSFIAQ